jgi:HK97 family phage major capsid protein
MPYNNIVSRADAASLVPLEMSNQILTGVVTKNPIMQLAKRLPNMSTNQRRMPVMSALATAYFVAGDTGLKQTSEVNWANRFIDAEELAVIVPIPQAVLDDSGFPIWTEVRPQMEEAISVAVTNALLYGTNIPATWTVNLNGSAGLVAGAIAAGTELHVAAYTDLYEAILGINGAGAVGTFGAVEANGFSVTGTVAHPAVRGALRNVRDGLGNPIFKTNMQDSTRYELDGTPIYFPTDGSMVAATCTTISGQWDQLVYAMRQDITFTIATEGVIQDAGGAIVYNLFQQDMVALRAVIRLGFAMPNPINRMQAVAATRFPFSVLVP